MQFDVKELDKIKREITVKVEPEELGSLEANVINKIKKTASLPGFRPGRMPEGLIRKSYAGIIKSEVLEKAISQYYEEVIDKVEFMPISQGKITGLQFDGVQSGLEFKIEIEAEPQIELKKYKGLNVEKDVPLVTDQMVDNALQELRERFATVKAAERVEEGYYVTFSAQLLGEGDIPVVGKKFEDVNVKIGSGEFDIELEKRLIGLEVDQETIIRNTTPPPFGEKDQSPVIENYKVKIVSIEERELPPLDDELAKNIQEENIDNLDQLKDLLRGKLEGMRERRSLQQFNSHLIDELLKENPFEVPESKVEGYLQYVLEDMKRQFPNQKLDETLIRQKYRVDAIHTIRWHMLKQRIVEVESIEVFDHEIFQRIDSADKSEAEKNALKKDAKVVSRLKADILEEKVLKLLADHAEVIEIFPMDSRETKFVAKVEESGDAKANQQMIASK